MAGVEKPCKALQINYYCHFEFQLRPKGGLCGGGGFSMGTINFIFTIFRSGKKKKKMGNKSVGDF